MDITNKFFYKNNRLQQIRGFCYTVRLGNVSKAAKHLNVSQSTVSLQIKSLEDELGVSLFERNGPVITLSEKGNMFYQMAIPHLEGIQELVERFHCRLAEQKETMLHIGANNTTLNFILPKLLRRYFESSEKQQVTVHYTEQEEAVSKLLSGKITVAILPKREHKPFPPSCRFTTIFSYEAALITRHDHPLKGKKNLTIQEISAYPISLPSEELRVIPNLYTIFPQDSINKNLRIQFVNWETTRRYIEEGLVISISSNVIIGDNDVLCGTSLAHLFPSVEYGFVTLAGKAIPEPIKRLIDIAQEDALAKAA